MSSMGIREKLFRFAGFYPDANLPPLLPGLAPACSRPACRRRGQPRHGRGPRWAAGPFRVACSNVAQDAALIAQSGAPRRRFLGRQTPDGQPATSRRCSAAPDTAVRFDAAGARPSRALPPARRAGPSTHVAIVCHPDAGVEHATPTTPCREPATSSRACRRAGARAEADRFAEYFDDDRRCASTAQARAGPAAARRLLPRPGRQPHQRGLPATRWWSSPPRLRGGRGVPRRPALLAHPHRGHRATSPSSSPTSTSSSRCS